MIVINLANEMYGTTNFNSTINNNKNLDLVDQHKDFCHDGVYRHGGPCPVCKRPFKTASGISHHMRIKHPNY